MRNKMLSTAFCAALITACSLVVAIAPASAKQAWTANHFVNQAGTIECKGFFLQEYQQVVLTCSNMGTRIGVIPATGASGSFVYDWGKNPVKFGQQANILRGRWSGWGVTCRGGVSWIQCWNADGHGVFMHRTTIDRF